MTASIVETPGGIGYHVGMPVHISRLLFERIMALALGAPDREVCGLLLGAGDRIEGIRPAENVAENAYARFEIDPAVLLAAHRHARQGGIPVIGHYHSHPTGSSAPSVADAGEANADGMMWLIIGNHDARLWGAGQGGLHGRFTELPLIVDAD